MKKIRKGILAGQITLLGLGIFLFVVFYDTIQRIGVGYYRGPGPGWILILGIICIVAAALLSSVLRYEVKNEDSQVDFYPRRNS